MTRVTRAPIVFVMILFLISGVVIVSGSAHAQDDYTRFRYDYVHSGYVEGEAPDTNETGWVFDTNESRWLVSSPMVVNGYVYIGSDNGKLYKLYENNGTEVWNYTASGSAYAGFWSSPCVDQDSGLVLCHASGVHAVDIETGEQVWHFQTMNREFCSPVVWEDRVYVGSYDEHLYCLPLEDPNEDGTISTGEVIWYYETGEYESGAKVEGTGGAVSTTPAIYSDMVFAAEQTNYNEENLYCDYNIFCLPLDDPDESGVIEHDEIIWKYKIGEKVPICDTDIPGEGGDAFSSPTINPSLGQVYIGSRDYNMYCFDIEKDDDGIDNDLDGITDNEGKRIWTFESDNEIYSTASYHDGTLFFGTGYNSHGSTGSFYAIPEEDPNGDGTISYAEMEWNYTNDDPFLSSALLADGYAIVGGIDGYLYVFDQSNGTILWRFLTDDDGEQAIGSSPALYDERIIFGCCNGRVYSLNELSNNTDPVIDLLGPANGIRTQAEPILSWEASDEDDDNLTFDLYLGTDRDDVDGSESSSLVLEGTANTSCSPDVEGGTLYYWKVVAFDQNSSTESVVWNFTPNNVPELVLTAPADDVTLDVTSTDLEWVGSDDDEDPIWFEVRFGKETPPVVVSENQTEETYGVSNLKDGKTYYWQVVVWDAYDEVVSDIRSFEIDLTPPNTVPEIGMLSPDDGGTISNASVTLEWEGSDADEDDLTYDVYLDTVPDPLVKVADAVTDETFEAYGLTDGITYYWKVVVNDGTETVASDVWSFDVEIENTLPEIELYLPGDDTEIITTTPMLYWVCDDPDDQELTYSVYLSTSPDAGTPIAEDIEDCSYQVMGLKAGRTYYWKVVAFDGEDEVTSPVWEFKVKDKDGGDDDDDSIPGFLPTETVAALGVASMIFYARKRR